MHRSLAACKHAPVDVPRQHHRHPDVGLRYGHPGIRGIVRDARSSHRGRRRTERDHPEARKDHDQVEHLEDWRRTPDENEANIAAAHSHAVPRARGSPSDSNRGSIRATTQRDVSQIDALRPRGQTRRRRSPASPRTRAAANTAQPARVLVLVVAEVAPKPSVFAGVVMAGSSVGRGASHVAAHGVHHRGSPRDPAKGLASLAFPIPGKAISIRFAQYQRNASFQALLHARGEFITASCAGCIPASQSERPRINRGRLCPLSAVRCQLHPYHQTLSSMSSGRSS